MTFQQALDKAWFACRKTFRQQADFLEYWQDNYIRYFDRWLTVNAVQLCGERRFILKT